eukprot:5126695-Pleurochrysis_carterae.AAC.1
MDQICGRISNQLEALDVVTASPVSGRRLVHCAWNVRSASKVRDICHVPVSRVAQAYKAKLEPERVCSMPQAGKGVRQSDSSPSELYSFLLIHFGDNELKSARVPLTVETRACTGS